MEPSQPLTLKRWHGYAAAALFLTTTLLVGLPNAVALLNGGLVGLSTPDSRLTALNANLNRLIDETQHVANSSTENATQISNLLLLVNRNIVDLRDVSKRLTDLERRVSRPRTKTGD